MAFQRCGSRRTSATIKPARRWSAGAPERIAAHHREAGHGSLAEYRCNSLALRANGARPLTPWAWPVWYQTHGPVAERRRRGCARPPSLVQIQAGPPIFAICMGTGAQAPVPFFFPRYRIWAKPRAPRRASPRPAEGRALARPFFVPILQSQRLDAEAYRHL